MIYDYLTQLLYAMNRSNQVATSESLNKTAGELAASVVASGVDGSSGSGTVPTSTGVITDGTTVTGTGLLGDPLTVGNAFSIETTIGTTSATHSLTTVAGQRVIVWAKGNYTASSGSNTVYLKYNGVTKDEADLNNIDNDDLFTF